MVEVKKESAESARSPLVDEFETIMVEYITKVSSRYRGNEFTSSQLAKTIVNEERIGKTRFPIVHRIVKCILSTWEKLGLCTHISTTKYSRCRKTKDTYRFTVSGLKEIKRQAIDDTIQTIEKGELRATPIMRTKESIAKDRLEELLENAGMTSVSD
jgi:DNA-binding PadR family transcriptional regulator